MKVGVVGLGAMVRPWPGIFTVPNLLAQVWNRSADKAQALAAETGCIAAPDPESLARACAVVISRVSADQDLLAVVDALLPGAHAGLIVCDCSTIAADTAREAAQRPPRPARPSRHAGVRRRRGRAEGHAVGDGWR